jgi:hypothetical protein
MSYKDPEKQREASRKWRLANPEKQKAATRNWQRAHPERVKAANLKYKALNRDKNIEQARQWRETHPERVREYRRNTRQLLPREAAIENYLREKVEALNGLALKFLDPGQRGAPDRLVVLHGHPTYYVELKRPQLGKLSAAQIRYHQRLRNRGQRVWVLNNKEEVDAFIVEVQPRASKHAECTCDPIHVGGHLPSCPRRML